MSARDIIAKLISGAPFPSKRTYDRVDGALEAAARVADKRADMAGTVSHEADRELLVALPDAIRALKASPVETYVEAKQE